jgi:hypothetical protein
MTRELEYHPTAFILTPCLAFCDAQCENPNCTARHFQISFGWFIWTLHVRFGDDEIFIE